MDLVIILNKSRSLENFYLEIYNHKHLVIIVIQSKIARLTKYSVLLYTHKQRKSIEINIICEEMYVSILTSQVRSSHDKACIQEQHIAVLKHKSSYQQEHKTQNKIWEKLLKSTKYHSARHKMHLIQNKRIYNHKQLALSLTKLFLNNSYFFKTFS